MEALEERISLRRITLSSLRTSLLPRPNLYSAIDPNAQPVLEHLNAQLHEFYNSTFMPRYFEVSEKENTAWTQLKAHWHLKNSIPQGSRVLELGCGAAHPCRHMADRQITYTGVDWSEYTIARNSKQWPNHTFLPSSLYNVALSDDSFDAVISLYVIEHLAWPHRLLDEMYRLVRPGGLIGILCPPFRIRSYIKSFDYGLSPRPFREKLKSGRLFDAALHLYQHRIAYPILLKRRYPRGPIQHRFLINIKPVCLQYPTWFPDADAVYLADTQEIVSYLAGKGVSLVQEWPKEGYVLMQKNASQHARVVTIPQEKLLGSTREKSLTAA